MAAARGAVRKRFYAVSYGFRMTVPRTKIGFRWLPISGQNPARSSVGCRPGQYFLQGDWFARRACHLARQRVKASRGPRSRRAPRTGGAFRRFAFRAGEAARTHSARGRQAPPRQANVPPRHGAGAATRWAPAATNPERGREGTRGRRRPPAQARSRIGRARGRRGWPRRDAGQCRPARNARWIAAARDAKMAALLQSGAAIRTVPAR